MRKSRILAMVSRHQNRRTAPFFVIRHGQAAGIMANKRLSIGALFALRGLYPLRRGQGLPPSSPHPFSASGILPPLRFGQVSLDEAEHFPHNRVASLATLRWCSGSSRNAVRLSFGRSVQLHRNPHLHPEPTSSP